MSRKELEEQTEELEKQMEELEEQMKEFEGQIIEIIQDICITDRLTIDDKTSLIKLFMTLL